MPAALLPVIPNRRAYDCGLTTMSRSGNLNGVVLRDKRHARF